MEHDFKIVKLHDVPTLVEETALLLNSEWPRSLEARCDVIRQSSNDLPCSFVLVKIESHDNLQAVVGYSRLSKVLQKPKAVIVESVIVDKTLRGCGFGKMIMMHIEEYALCHGYETIYLSTHDKQSFYEHLGYSLSTPVSAVTKASRLFFRSQVEKVDKSAKHKKGVSIIKEAGNLKSEENLSSCVALFQSPALSAQLPTSLPVSPAPPFWIPSPPSVPSQAVGKQISSSVKFYSDLTMEPVETLAAPDDILSHKIISLFGTISVNENATKEE